MAAVRALMVCLSVLLKSLCGGVVLPADLSRCRQPVPDCAGFIAEDVSIPKCIGIVCRTADVRA